VASIQQLAKPKPKSLSPRGLNAEKSKIKSEDTKEHGGLDNSAKEFCVLKDF